jgi:hypothetical protein
MTPSTTLTGSHLRTYNTIFQHPVSHNLEWSAVRALMGKIGEVTEEPNGNLKVLRNGRSLVLHPHHTKDVAETEELMVLRHFIRESEGTAAGAPGEEAHWLLVIDHHVARIYRSEMRDAVPQRIHPHEPDEYFRHAHNSKDFSRGREKPDPNSFFEPVARALQAAGQILIFGTGKGTSSEMEQLVGWLGQHHPDVAKRIIGSLVVDESHLSDSQLLAKAREFYAGAGAAAT